MRQSELASDSKQGKFRQGSRFNALTGIEEGEEIDKDNLDGPF